MVKKLSPFMDLTNLPLYSVMSQCSPVDAFWKRTLGAGERRIGVAEFADILEVTNWLPGELQSSLVRLVKAGIVRNLDADASKRRTKPLHFDKAERFQLTRSIE
jgi:hypothetical protein